MPLKSTGRKGDRGNATKLVPGLFAALFALAANLGSATFESGSGAFLTCQLWRLRTSRAVP